MGNPLLAVPETTPIPVLLNAKQLASGGWALQVADSNQTPAATGGSSVVSISPSSSTLLAANLTRRGATIYNTHASTIAYIALGTNATTSLYTVKLVPGAYYETPFGFTGLISAVGSASGTLNVTELQ
jgi:hypothetical protein